MPCKEYARIRAKDVGRKKHHYIKFGVTTSGKTERIGGLRSYKTYTTRRHHLRKVTKGITPVRTHPMRTKRKNSRFNPTLTLKRLEAGLTSPHTLTDKQKLLIMQEQEKQEQEKRRLKQAQTIYDQKVSEGKIW